eukprot:TRINITY_DN67527_c8_g13_i1.p1 TRINITY_DN67527_c8_g13~~TRINITY_DN67527_c8_g13_i1.p1  ORF type:complete len:340 (+),score=68.99 TRINITY_DN67527_c8_g13_i1:59-1021(+)
MAEAPKLQRLEEGEVVEGCRYYEKKYPELEDIVVVRVTNISDTAAYVQLLEYNGIEGMIPLSELSRRRIRSVNKHIRVGKTEFVQVFRVDSNKGYIDLSKKKVNAEDVKPCEVRYNKARDVYSIMKHVAEETKCNLESLQQCVAWPLYQQYGHAYDAFGMAVAAPEKVLGSLNLPDDVKSQLVDDIQHRHKSQPFRVRADIEVTCFTYEGIDAIKAALKAGEAAAAAAGDISITLKLLAAPTYVVQASAIDRDAGIKAVQTCIDEVEKVIKSKGGNMKIDKAPRIVTGDVNLSKEEGGEDKDIDEEDEEEEEEEEENEEE